MEYYKCKDVPAPYDLFLEDLAHQLHMSKWNLKSRYTVKELFLTTYKHWYKDSIKQIKKTIKSNKYYHRDYKTIWGIRHICDELINEEKDYYRLNRQYNVYEQHTLLIHSRNI